MTVPLNRFLKAVQTFLWKLNMTYIGREVTEESRIETSENHRVKENICLMESIIPSELLMF